MPIARGIVRLVSSWPRVSKELAHYTLDERLDSGGSVAVHRALSARDGRQVVVTMCPGPMSERWPPWADPRLAQILDHPNIVRLLDVVEASDHVAFVTEHVDGVDLRKILLHGPVSLASALFVAAELCRGLHAAHHSTGLDGTSFAFTHGWLCPRCIFVSREGAVKLGGFGTGRIQSDEERLSLMHAWVEPFSYLAPEHLRGEEPEPRTDLFLLGIVLHEMIAGERPFVGDTPEALAGAIKNGRRRALSTGIPAPAKQAMSAQQSLRLAMDDLIGWTLSPRPDERPQSAAELLGALEALARRFESSLGHDAPSQQLGALVQRLAQR
jgi:serine/threonine protein kinase